MSELLTSILIIGTEISAVLIILTGIFLFFHGKKKRKDKALSDQFINTFKDNLDNRRHHIESQLESADENKEEILKIIENILTKEKTIYGKMLRIFNGSDKNLILDIQDDLHALTDEFGVHIKKEENTANVVTPEMEARMKDLEKKNKIYKIENDRLKDDLKKALETIDSIQAEYEQLYKKTKDLEQK